MKWLVLTLITFNLGCASQSLDDYANAQPQLDLQKFFQGKVMARGIVQDRSGKVIKRFVVDIDSSWQNNVGTLDETFDYADGSKGKRIWTLKKTGDNSFEGTASDVVGVAKGNTKGNTFYFEYVLEVPVDDSLYEVKLKDWMYLVDENTLMARSYMSKWGFNLGEVTLVMTRE